MFKNLSDKLTASLDKLRRKGALSESDIDEAMREVRLALLDADVALPVVKSFVKTLKEKALGETIIKSVSPAQMVIKLVQDHLTELLGSEHQDINLATTPPAVIMMVGLQGSGKTTSTGKLGKRLKDKQNKKVLVASLDVQRPAAQEQLATVAEQAGIESLEIIKGQSPQEITKRALDAARKQGFDILMLDTAGRLQIDDELMDELEDVKKLAKPVETLLVVDSLIGQDAVNVAQGFHDKIEVTGTVLTRIDGDGRGGAALSMRHVTGQPIKFMGTGEKLTDFEAFHPERIASRILDMGDIVSLVEQAAEAVDQQDAEDLAKRMAAGTFDFNDMLKQMQQLKKMGGITSMMGMLPGIGKIKDQLAGANVDEGMMKRTEALILSMTPKERQFPKLLNASRRKRIASGAGCDVQDVNKLVKQYQTMEKMMKKMKKFSKKGKMPANMDELMNSLR
ncbi:MAG: signal recognition particle protein [Rickettsiales bacterium]|nr:signal recognition particle protein [Rickettsiales bacterium]